MVDNTDHRQIALTLIIVHADLVEVRPNSAIILSDQAVAKSNLMQNINQFDVQHFVFYRFRSCKNKKK